MRRAQVWKAPSGTGWVTTRMEGGRAVAHHWSEQWGTALALAVEWVDHR